MKMMIASDLHGSAYYTEKLLAAYREEGAGKLLLLGDILYHGPRNDLPKEYAPKKVIEMLNGMREEILCVRGNCDTEVDQMVLQFPILADYCILYLGETMIFATHGHHFNNNSLPMIKPGDILLHCPEFDAAKRQFCTTTDLDEHFYSMMESNYDTLALLDLRRCTNVFGALERYLTIRDGMTKKSYALSPADFDEDGYPVDLSLIHISPAPGGGPLHLPVPGGQAGAAAHHLCQLRPAPAGGGRTLRHRQGRL